ncbi:MULTISPECIES: DUF4149 domain-containing protein [unclassified Campylobacter]|uniref:DUF4149 domain-containing protein n=1 Tax=unclassified Campylobacter TaxID=2593542 RepID=UPI0014731319|nr:MULTISPECIES: DUF4149 domain-containing protein [unclassified Campylobacter]
MKGLYLLLLAALIGIEISIGAFIAPTLFYPQSIIGDGVLTHFQSGLLMTNIFVKFNYVLIAVAILALVYELFMLRSDVKFALKFSSFMLALINFALATSFVFYFTPYVLNAQALGEAGTTTPEFFQMHKASELVMKVMMVAQLLLFFIKFPRAKEA